MGSLPVVNRLGVGLEYGIRSIRGVAEGVREGGFCAQLPTPRRSRRRKIKRNIKLKPFSSSIVKIITQRIELTVI
jgi:hypothetical protein